MSFDVDIEMFSFVASNALHRRVFGYIKQQSFHNLCGFVDAPVNCIVADGVVKSSRFHFA